MSDLVQMICGTCGSTDVRSDAYAAWDLLTQSWELSATFDKGSICETCGGECRLAERPLNEEEKLEIVAVDEEPMTPDRMLNALRGAAAENRTLRLALAPLVDWCREHTSPTDDNSPHALLLIARAALLRAGGRA